MTDEQQAVPPTFTPRTVAPRPDGLRRDVPPPPPASVATGTRGADARGEIDDTTVRRAPEGDSTSTMDAFRRAARSVTSVVTGEQTGATPAVAAPQTAAYVPQQAPVTTAPAPAAAQQAPAAQPSPAASQPAAAAPHSNGAPRRVRLVVSRVNPWSVMKMAFLLSIALGIITVVAAAVVWSILNSMHLFSSINDLIEQIVGNETQVNVLQYVAFSRTMSMSTLIAVVNIVLVTALATLGAFLYNIASALVGGVHVTLTDD